MSSTAQPFIQAGGKDNGPPGLRPQYHENYYGALVIGPDGHRRGLPYPGGLILQPKEPTCARSLSVAPLLTLPRRLRG